MFCAYMVSPDHNLNSAQACKSNLEAWFAVLALQDKEGKLGRQSYSWTTVNIVSLYGYVT